MSATSVPALPGLPTLVRLLVGALLGHHCGGLGVAHAVETGATGDPGLTFSARIRLRPR